MKEMTRKQAWLIFGSLAMLLIVVFVSAVLWPQGDVDEIFIEEQRVIDRVIDVEEKVLVRRQRNLVFEDEEKAFEMTIASRSSQSLRDRELRQVFAEAKQVYEMEATAYTHTGNPTFTGIMPYVGVIAVDPKVIPLGTKLYVEGYGFGLAADTGGVIKGDIIDLFMDTKEEALQWGRRQVRVYIL